jgi:large subunit ribosomal protein L10
MARADKEASVAEITERFNDSDAALLTEYRGLRVSEIAEVRTALRDSDTDYKVLKNTLTRLAVREVGLEELVEMLTGPTAIAFIRGDAAAAAKALDDASKKYPVLTIKGGVLNGKVIDAEQAKQLAKLEPREVLLAKIAMMMNQPAQQTVNVFAALLRDLGSMLAQVVAQKESEAPAPEEAPEAAAPVEAGPPAEATAADESTDEPATEVSAEPVEAEDAEQAADAAAEEPSPAADVTEAAAETTPEETPAEEAATEAEPPAELAEAVDQAPAAPESDAAEVQETDESATKEEE